MTLAQAEIAKTAAETLSQAQDVQQVLAYVCGALLAALIAVVVFHVKQRAAWDVELALPTSIPADVCSLAHFAATMRLLRLRPAAWPRPCSTYGGRLVRKTSEREHA